MLRGIGGGELMTNALLVKVRGQRSVEEFTPIVAANGPQTVARRRVLGLSMALLVLEGLQDLATGLSQEDTDPRVAAVVVDYDKQVQAAASSLD
jgi:hypothetical protein